MNGVQTAYELFEYTRMDGYCIAEIKKILRKSEYTEDVPEKNYRDGVEGRRV